MTQSEFAKILSVSQATVSLALRDDQSISPAMRERIKKMADEVGYRPNIAGQMLRRRKSNLLGVILPSLHHRFYAELVAELLNYARTRGYIIVPIQAENNEDFNKAICDLKKFNISEIAAICGVEMINYVITEKLNIVILEAYNHLQENAGQLSHIFIDLKQGGYDITGHLLRRGCRHPVFVGRYSYEEPRFQGFLCRCREAGIAENRFIAGHRNTLKEGYELATQLLQQFPDTDGVLAHNDEVAIGILRRFRELNIKAPDDIAVAGFDNIPIGEYHSPSLTSVGPDLRLYAKCIIDELLKLQDSNSGHRTIKIPCHIFERETV